MTLTKSIKLFLDKDNLSTFFSGLYFVSFCLSSLEERKLSLGLSIYHVIYGIWGIRGSSRFFAILHRGGARFKVQSCAPFWNYLFLFTIYERTEIRRSFCKWLNLLLFWNFMEGYKFSSTSRSPPCSAGLSRGQLLPVAWDELAVNNVTMFV